MLLISKASLLIISVLYFLSECPKRQKEFKTQSTKIFIESNENIPIPSDKESTGQLLNDKVKRKLVPTSPLQRPTELGRSLSSYSSQSDRLYIAEDIEEIAPLPEQIKIDDVKLHPVNVPSLQHGSTVYKSAELKSIDNDLDSIIHNFIISFPIGTPEVVIRTLEYSLGYGLREYIYRVRQVDFVKFFSDIKNKLIRCTSYFIHEYNKETSKYQKTPLTYYRIFKKIPFIWIFMIHRASNFPPNCIGFRLLLTLSEKLNGLYFDYELFLNDGREDFHTLISELIKKFDDTNVDANAKLSMIDTIDKFQIIFSIFRYYRGEFNTIYPDLTSQKLLLLMTIFYVPGFEKMQTKCREFILTYMNNLGIQDISVFDDSRLMNVQNSEKIKIFAELTRLYIKREKVHRSEVTR